MKRIVKCTMAAMLALCMLCVIGLPVHAVTTDEEAAAEVQALIDTIRDMGELTLEDEETIRTIKASYDALTKAQRALVDATLLLDALEQIAQLRQEQIDRLIELIDEIGEVTLEDEAIINEAMDVYEWMTMDERTQVDYATLLSASKTLASLQEEAPEIEDTTAPPDAATQSPDDENEEDDDEDDDDDDENDDQVFRDEDDNTGRFIGIVIGFAVLMVGFVATALFTFHRRKR